MSYGLKKTIELLNRYNLRAKKKFGQNFLVDSNIINNIIESVSMFDGVLEIGPGLGALTGSLVDASKKVVCYEIDSDMVEILKNEIKSEKLVVKKVDFLEVDLLSELREFDGIKNVAVVSNLPYYITTPIIFKLLKDETIVTDMYFMVQKEVASRFNCKPKTKDYSSLSVLINYQADVEVLFDVGRNCFYPVPDVDSRFIHIQKVKREYEANNRAEFVKFVQAIFEMKRKTLVNNILHKYSFSKEKIIEVLNKYNYKESIRAEELTVEEIVRLFNDLFF